MGTNDAQISYKMPDCYGVNLPACAKATKMNIYERNGLVEIPRGLRANFRGKTLRREQCADFLWPFFLKNKNKILKQS